MAIALIVVVGLVKSGEHGFHAVAPVPRGATQALGVLLILRAFSSGATAMTGIEVISNAVPVFEPPEAENARRTLSVMIVLLVTMFAGVVVIAHLDAAAPGSQTVLSQIAHRSVGNGPLYGYVQLATTRGAIICRWRSWSRRIARPSRRWQRLLHNRIAQRLRKMLIVHEGIVVTSVPFHLPG